MFLTVALIFIGGILVATISARTSPVIEEAEQLEVEEKVEGTEKKAAQPQEEKKIAEQETDPEQEIEKIEFYLDGPRESGIFLGETAVGIKREDIQNIYGQQFLNSGFEYNIDLSGLQLEPGLHTLFVYSITDQGDYDYCIKEITVKGNPAEADLNINVDSPQNLSIIKPGAMDVQGWALNPAAVDNTGIKNIRLYLDGPMDTGIYLGGGAYGSIIRSDVADVFGSQFRNCGFSLPLDTSELRPNEKHYLYLYAQKTDDSWEKKISQFYIYDGNFRSNIFLEIGNFIPDFTINAGESVNIKGSSFYINDPQSFYAQKEYTSKQVVFVSDRAGRGNFDLFISNLDGSNLRKLTDNDVDDLYPNASPDGTQIAFTSEVGGLWQVFIINADGTGLRQITTSNTLNAYPDWSHDGQYLFYESRVGDVWEVYRIGADGNNPERLTFNSESHDWHPATHPFRPLVLFESGTKEDLKIMDYNGENVNYITKDDQRNRVPYFASDGKTIVFSKYLGGNGEIFIMDITGEVLAQITANGATNTHPIFSPDDKYIGFDSDVSGKQQVYIYSFEDGSVFNLINDTQNNYKDPCFIFE